MVLVIFPDFHNLVQLMLFWQFRWPHILLRHLTLVFFCFELSPSCSTCIPKRQVCGLGEVCSHLLPTCMAEHYFVPLIFSSIWSGHLPWTVVWHCYLHCLPGEGEISHMLALIHTLSPQLLLFTFWWETSPGRAIWRSMIFTQDPSQLVGITRPAASHQLDPTTSKRRTNWELNPSLCSSRRQCTCAASNLLFC